MRKVMRLASYFQSYKCSGCEDNIDSVGDSHLVSIGSVSIGSASTGGSRGVSQSEDHEECLHRRFTRSVSIGGSREVSPLEVNEECLHRRITRSASIRGSQGVSPSEYHEACLHRRFTRSVSIGGSRGVSLSESTRSVSIGVPIILDHPEVARSELVVVAGLEVARLELVVARLEVARPELFVARLEVARPELFVARLEVARPELVVSRMKVARPELVVVRPEVARPELVVFRPDVVRPELVVVARLETFGVHPEIDLISFGDVWGSTRDRFNLVWRRLGLSVSHSYRDDTNDDSNATLKPMYVEDIQMRFLLLLLPRPLKVVIILNLLGLKILPQKMFLLIEVARKVFPIHLPRSLENTFSYFMLNMLSFASSKGVGEGKDVTTNKLNEDANPNGEHLSVKLARPKEANHALEKENHSRWYIWYHHSEGGHELTRESALTKDCTFTPGYIWYHRSKPESLLLPKIAPSLQGRYGTTTPEEARSASPLHALPVFDVSWTLRKVGILGLLLRSQLAKVAQPDHQWYQVHHEEDISRSYPFRTKVASHPTLFDCFVSDIPIQKRSKKPLSPLPKGSGAPGGGRTTPKKEARSSHSFHQKDGSARIVLDERITEYAHEVTTIGCDSKLPLGKTARDLDLLWFLSISKDPLEELLLALFGGYLPWELLNLYLLISMEKFSMSSFYPTRASPSALRRLVALYLREETGCSLPPEGLATLYLLRRLAGPYLLRRLAALYLLRRLVVPYLLERHYSLVILSGPEVAFVTPAILVDHFNMEWFCKDGLDDPKRELYESSRSPLYQVNFVRDPAQRRKTPKRPGKNTPQCYTKPLDSLKNWNNRFFWVDECVFPITVDWRTNASKDGMPANGTYSVEAVRVLDTHRTPIQKQPEMLLCLVEIDLFSLIRAPNLTKVKTGSRPRAPHELPLLTLTSPHVIEMDEPAAATDSSGVPSTIERSPLDFDHEAEASGRETVDPEMPPPKDVPITTAPGTDHAVETDAVEPPAIRESRKKGHEGTDANAPPKSLRRDHADLQPSGIPAD
nr:hypothetical protein [Tanacetum cinerariifolium]